MGLGEGEEKNSSSYQIFVVEETGKKKIVATATLILEKKFIRGCGLAGHVEDVVVDESVRGQKLGLR
jgi:glucosamine-phosphate N-acetyltransferase